MNYAFYKAAFFAVLSGVLHGTLGFFGVQLQRHGLGLIELLWWRFLFASVIVAAILYFQKTRIVFSQDSATIFLIASIFYGSASALYFSAANFLGTGLAMVLVFCYPVVVVTLLWSFENYRPSLSIIAILLLTIVGLILLIDLNNIQISTQGILMGLFCALLFGTYFYLSQKYFAHLSVWSVTFWICFGNFTAFTLIFVQQGDFSYKMNFNIFAHLLGISTISTLLPIYLIFKSLDHLNATQASLLSVSKPVVTLLIGSYFLNELISIYQLIGTFFIITSVLLILQEKKMLTHNNYTNLKDSERIQLD